MRIEKDFIGEVRIPEDALYGIHSMRARDNFPDRTPFHVEWFRAMATVKRACYLTVMDYVGKVAEKYDPSELPVKLPAVKTLGLLLESAEECEQEKHLGDFIVPAVSGGAGTSINMNINEILANLALLKSQHKPGEYAFTDPVEDANIFQSTNDVVPTALRIAAMHLLNTLEESINQLRAAIETKEKEFRDILRISFTQMQEAVPTTFGRLFSSYNDALSRDWWRISKCLERIKVVNLGGSAIGTSVAVPKYFMLEVVRKLSDISGLPVTRSENLSEATSNLDSLTEVHGIIKTHAVNLEKMVSDLRLLGSDITGKGGIILPQKQAGSSIMPGKVNPVIPEFIISSAHRIYSNDILIAGLAAQGCLELNAYLPVIGHALLESIKLLIACNKSCKEHLITGLVIDREYEERKLLMSPSAATILLPYIGYNKAGDLARTMKQNNMNIFDANKQLGLITEEKLRELLKPENLVQGGFRLKDFMEDTD